MATIYCDINQCDASVQYFSILHAVKETHNTKNTLTLTFIRKTKPRSTMRQKLFVARHMTIVATESLCSAAKNFTHTRKLVPDKYCPDLIEKRTTDISRLKAMLHFAFIYKGLTVI